MRRHTASMSASVLVSVAQTSNASCPRNRVRSKPPRMFCAASAVEHRRDRPIERSATSWKYGPSYRRSMPSIAHSPSTSASCSRATASRPAQALEAQQRHVDRRRSDHESLVRTNIRGRFRAANVLLARLQGQSKPGLPSRSVVRPTMRPGICRTCFCLQVMKPKYGPPDDSGTPSG